jgi:hypothetical protein
MNGKANSTIESVESIDTAKRGVHIWLNHKLVFVRKQIPNINSQREEVTLTMLDAGQKK